MERKKRQRKHEITGGKKKNMNEKKVGYRREKEKRKSSFSI